MTDSTWRDIEGVAVEPGDSGNYPDPPLPRNAPITTDFEGPWGIPYLDGLESPFAATDQFTPSPEPQIDKPDVGWAMGPGDYRGEYRTLGPVQAWGHEVSGGWFGDQAVGRIMRFPANIPERYDANGVNVGDYRDLLAGSIAANKVPMFTDTNIIDDLVTWTGDDTFSGWGS
jgi:hypothetical protein